jgi:flagellin
MPISLGINVESLQAQRNLSGSTAKLSKVYERLASGQRINRAADDAAGLSIAEILKLDQRIATVAIRNANDGISLVAIADGALAELGQVLNRMAELSEQSANGVFSNQQRSALANEFVSLGSEVERITKTTLFNDIPLLSSTADITLQVGFDSQSTSQVTIKNVNSTLSALGLASLGSPGLSFSILDNTMSTSQEASRKALDAIRGAIRSLSFTRGQLGGSESRLRSAITNLSVARENYAAAESQIRDADIASEAAELTRLGILQQAGASVLAQANQQPSLALQLIGG